MKLLFLIDNSFGIGGGDYSIFKFAEYLARIGNEVYVFAAKKDEFFEKYELPKTIKIRYRGAFPRLFRGCGRADLWWDRIYTKIFISGFIRKNKDIDYIIGYQMSSAIKATALGKGAGIKLVNFVFECPGWLEKQLGKKWAEDYSKPAYRKLWGDFKSSLEKADIIFANSNLTKKEAGAWLQRDIDGVVYPGLDTEQIGKIPEQEKKNQIIYIGRLHKYKNVDEIIKALSKIHNPPKLIICGDGEEKACLKNLARELNVKCDFMGRVTDYEKWKLIKESRLLVFPSSMEGFGMPPMEALICGVPCIASDIAVFKEIYGDALEYFKEHDVNGLSKKISYLIKNISYCRVRGTQGKRYAKKFTWMGSAKKIDGVLREKLKWS